jgi:hypothetical protein
MEFWIQKAFFDRITGLAGREQDGLCILDDEFWIGNCGLSSSAVRGSGVMKLANFGLFAAFDALMQTGTGFQSGCPPSFRIPR